LLQTCYDLRFPVFARNGINESGYDYDAIIYIASFPTPRMEAWRTLSAARAIENECFVASVNRTGKDIYCQYSGGSVLWDSFGEKIAECGDAECVVVAEIDMSALKERRKRFPTLRDADLFNIR
ncbi:MAG: nitrilase family protein, partial [Alistipes sp.]|nr:nitrilase family protein [Alistipes sp.]